MLMCFSIFLALHLECGLSNYRSDYSGPSTSLVCGSVAGIASSTGKFVKFYFMTLTGWVFTISTVYGTNNTLIANGQACKFLKFQVIVVNI